jgi:hypothetical protein
MNQTPVPHSLFPLPLLKSNSHNSFLIPHSYYLNQTPIPHSIPLFISHYYTLNPHFHFYCLHHTTKPHSSFHTPITYVTLPHLIPHSPFPIPITYFTFLHLIPHSPLLLLMSHSHTSFLITHSHYICHTPTPHSSFPLPLLKSHSHTSFLIPHSYY